MGHRSFLDIMIKNVNYRERTPGEEKRKKVLSQTNEPERKMQKTKSFAKLSIHPRPNLWFLTY